MESTISFPLRKRPSDWRGPGPTGVPQPLCLWCPEQGSDTRRPCPRSREPSPLPRSLFCADLPLSSSPLSPVCTCCVGLLPCGAVPCVPAAPLSGFLCPDNREGGQRVCHSHPSQLVIHLQTEPLQTPRTCSTAAPAGAAASLSCCCGEQGAACSLQHSRCLPVRPAPPTSALLR